MEGINSTTVVLQHQNRLVREMLAGHLVREPGITLAGTAPSGPELIQLCTLRKPTVAVFEADAPRWSNERLVSLLLQSGRDIRMVGVHDALPTAYVIRAYDAGVSALVSYTSGLEALLEAVKNPLLPVEAARAKRVDGHTLTERELQVLYLISAGYPPKQVATELGISLHTVENHKQRIFAKLDVHNQAHAAASAVRLGLLPRTVPMPRQEPRLPRRRRRLGVVLRDPTGRLSGRIREVLAEHHIPIRDESGDGAASDGSEQELVITILVDPTEHDWPVPDRRAELVVAVTSREPKRSEVTKALSGGIATVPASRMDDLLVPAIRATAQGYVLVNSSYVRALLGPSHAGSNGGWQRWELALTPREREILNSIGRGHATKQTARLLGISIRTVENLQSNLFRKLRVHSRAAALVAAHDLGLLDE
ncbi:MAG TPA: response regulator transcription factor [Actinophytocola sp.]|uniref:response regulator transcription factor n=1 Tax=Actinophytocola sp. TaxID=1872138 RepID=UPI002DDD9C72|nr:response regulator transcription factor [Actinophytocola sp.]HEV2783884.1 response regulator transcription factor [Actinophytocola sp.]